MPIVRANAVRELSEFYPPPYGFLGPRRSPTVKRNRGMSAGQAVGTGISLATTGASVGAAAAGASSAALIGSLTLGAAIPIFGAIAAAIVPILVNAFSGCGSSCTLTSQAANQVEQLLQQNVNAYFASPRTAADQQAALAVFDNAWAQLVQYCGQPSFGQAGTNCVDDRQRGACTWKTSGCSLSSSTPPVWSCGPAGSGNQCWNWFVGYRDPIANDVPVPNPAAEAASSSASGAISNLFSASTPGGGFNFSGLILPGVLIVGGIFLFMGGRN